MPYSKQKAKEYAKEYYINNRQKMKEERLNKLTDAEREQQLEARRKRYHLHKDENRTRKNELNSESYHRTKDKLSETSKERKRQQTKEWQRKNLVCVKDESPEDRAQRLASTRQLMKQWEEERNQAQTTQSMDQDNQPKP